jgi:hypothetical protein
MQFDELDRNNIDIFKYVKPPVQDIRDVIHFVNHLMILLGKRGILPSEQNFYESYEAFIESQGKVEGDLVLEFYNMENA